MTDKREAILVRLLAIYRTVDGVATVARNKQVANDWEFPAIELLDADETLADPKPGARPAPDGLSLRIMTPETYLILGDLPENVGTELNRYRARIVKAVLTDAELLALVGRNGEIVFEDCATSLARAREIIGEMGLSFSFTYVLNPADL